MDDSEKLGRITGLLQNRLYAHSLNFGNFCFLAQPRRSTIGK
jgi:hypothetical protein